MPIHAPSIHKGNKWVLNRESKSSSSPTLPFGSSPISKDDLETMGLDAPKDPIQHLVPKASAMWTHSSEKKMKEKEWRRIEKRKYMVGKQSSRETMTAMKQIAKRKGKRVSMEEDISKETSSARVTQSWVKHPKLDGSDQHNTDTLVASSLFELLTFQVSDMTMSTSKKIFVSNALMGRVTRIKTRTLPRQVTHSSLAYIDLGAEDTPPPTPPARVGSDSNREIPEDCVVQRTKG